MNKHKSKEHNVRSQAKTGPNNLGFHHQVTKSESLDGVGRHGLRWHGRVDQSWFDCLGFPMINTSPGFWFSQSPSNAQFLALLPFASHSFSPTNPSAQEETQHGPSYLQLVFRLQGPCSWWPREEWWSCTKDPASTTSLCIEGQLIHGKPCQRFCPNRAWRDLVPEAFTDEVGCTGQGKLYQEEANAWWQREIYTFGFLELPEHFREKPDLTVLWKQHALDEDSLPTSFKMGSL